VILFSAAVAGSRRACAYVTIIMTGATLKKSVCFYREYIICKTKRVRALPPRPSPYERCAILIRAHALASHVSVLSSWSFFLIACSISKASST